MTTRREASGGTLVLGGGFAGSRGFLGWFVELSMLGHTGRLGGG